MRLVTIIGILASCSTGTYLLPQLVKLVKKKKADDISAAMLLWLFVGLSLWVWYGVLQHDLLIIISNSFSLLMNLIMAFLSLKYKSNQHPGSC